MGRSIYKYMGRAHAARMLADGEIRLGTLYTYRNEEELGPEVGDRDEGTLNLKKSGFTVVDTVDPRTIPAFFRNGLSVGSGARLQIIARDGIGRQFEDPDCWVYCTSKYFDRDQMNSMGYDTCVEIFDIEPFFFAVSREIQLRIRSFWGAAECVYRDRTVEHTAYDGIPPAFIKHPRFRGQTEVRALWIPKDGEHVEPVVDSLRRDTHASNERLGSKITAPT
jgi:hypothetical protein